MDFLPVHFKRLFKSRFFKFGAPFFAMMVGGWIGLRQFASLRYEYSNKVLLTPEEAAKYGIEWSEVTLESEYEKIKNLDIDNWENKRGPRPWENPEQIADSKR